MDIDYLLRQPLSGTARFDPDRPALSIGNDETLTYRDLASRSRRRARGLIALGVQPGDRVALMMFNSMEYWVCYFAITRIGAIVVRTNFRLSGEELEYALNDSGTSLAIADAELLNRVVNRREEISVDTYVCTTGHSDATVLTLTEIDSTDDSELDVPRPRDSEAAMIMYTSGTTGRPKGAVWTHSATTWFSAMQVIDWQLTSDTVIFVAGPLYHVGAMEDYSLPTLAVGGHVVFLESGAFDIEAALRIASRRGVTDLTLFPSMIYQMLQLEALSTIDLSRVRRIFTGGDPLLPWAVERIQELFSGVDVVQVYGLTEGTPIAACGGPGDAFVDPGSVGRAMAFCEISIRDDDGAAISDGEAGEIWTRSPANAREYWNKPEATAETFVDGWCRTGDLGTVRDGRLTVTGRKKDMIRSGGENIYAREVEDILMRHADVLDAAAIAVPDPTYREVVCAVIVKREGSAVSADEIVAHCAAHMASYKKPRYVVFVDALPRTPSAKIQKFILREQFAHLGAEK